MEQKAPKTPAPFIYWGQSQSVVFIKIALRDVQPQPDIGLTHGEISFKGNGMGAHGDSVYGFNIKPFKPIAPEKSKLRITGSDIQIEIHKRDPTTKDDPWPRLTKDTQKYPWIKPDFDKMDISDDEEENAIQRRQMEQEYLKKITGQVEETYAQAIEDVKRNYLFTYSLFQLIAYGVMTFRILYCICFKPDYEAYDDIGTVLIICQIFSFLEVIHPMVGLIKTSFIPPLIQTCGRNLIILVLIWNEPELQKDPVCTYLFFFWSLADTIRHPLYLLSSMKLELYIITWLRYTMWIPLYPLGAGCEWLITWKAIPLFEQSGRFSMSLPNTLNFSFSLTYYLYLHLIIIPFGLGKMMLHMASLRKKKLGGVKSTTGTTQSKAKKAN